MISRTWILLAALVWGGPAGAHAQSWSASRVDSHAPLGVMGDHPHEAGEWMLSFRAMRMVMDGNRTDTARVPADGVLADYPVTPLRMPMDMYMVGAMYAPTDRLTLVGMVPVLDISMDHRTRTGVEFTTESGGIGDVQMSALVGVAAGARQRAHLHLGVSAPTGSIDERGETPAATNVRLPYPMQVGSGTWNVLPGLTYLGQTDAWSWGAQAIGTVRLGENEYNYALGHRVSTTAWFSRRLSESASASLRLRERQRLAALLHESSRARTMPTDRILTGRCDTTLVGRGRSSDSGSHSRGRPHSPAQLDSGREGHRR